MLKLHKLKSNAMEKSSKKYHVKVEDGMNNFMGMFYYLVTIGFVKILFRENYSVSQIFFFLFLHVNCLNYKTAFFLRILHICSSSPSPHSFRYYLTHLLLNFMYVCRHCAYCQSQIQLHVHISPVGSERHNFLPVIQHLSLLQIFYIFFCIAPCVLRETSQS